MGKHSLNPGHLSPGQRIVVSIFSLVDKLGPKSNGQTLADTSQPVQRPWARLPPAFPRFFQILMLLGFIGGAAKCIGQRLENVNRTHLVQECGNLVLQKTP